MSARSLFFPYKNYADYLAAQAKPPKLGQRVARVERAQFNVFDSMGGEFPATSYPGQALNAIDGQNNVVGSLLFRELPSGELWVDSIYSQVPAQAMEMISYIRSNYPGRQVEGYFFNQRLKPLVDRYNQSQGFAPWDDNRRAAEAENTYAMFGAQPQRVASEQGYSWELLNPDKWNPKREEAWLRAWEALYEPWTTAHGWTSAIHLAGTEELAQKMVDSLLDRPDMKKMREAKEADSRRMLEAANWVYPVQDAIRTWSEEQGGETPTAMQAELIADLWRYAVQRDDAAMGRLADAADVGYSRSDMQGAILQKLRGPDWNFEDYPPKLENPYQIKPQVRGLAGSMRNELEYTGWDDALARSIRYYGYPADVLQQLGLDPEKNEATLMPDELREKAHELTGDAIKDALKKIKTARMGEMYDQLKGALERVLKYTPDGYKMYPWMIKHMKSQMEQRAERGSSARYDSDTLDAVESYGETLKHYQDNHLLPKGFDLNKMTPTQFVSWAQEELTEPHEDQSQIVYEYPDGWTIRELDPNYGEDFYSEGEQMNNCIKHYEPDSYNWQGKCAQGYSHIFSLRTPKNKAKVSIEAVGSEGSRSGGGWPRELNISQSYANSNSAPSPDLQARLDQWYEYLRSKGVPVNEHGHDMDFHDEDEPEHEPEHIERNDDWEEHPEGNVYVDDLSTLRNYGETMRHNATQFNRDEGLEPETHYDEEGDYWYTHYNPRGVESAEQEDEIAEEIAIEALEGETEEDQKQIFEDLEHLRVFIDHSMDQGYRQRYQIPDTADDIDGPHYAIKDLARFDQETLQVLQKTLADGREMQMLGLENFVYHWDDVKERAQREAVERGQGHNWQSLLPATRGHGVSAYKITQTGMTILENAIAYYQRLMKVDHSGYHWPDEDYNRTWRGFQAYDIARNAHESTLRPLPQYENIVQPWTSTQGMSPEMQENMEKYHLNDVANWDYPEGPDNQMSFLEKPAELPPAPVPPPDQEWRAIYPGAEGMLGAGPGQLTTTDYRNGLSQLPWIGWAQAMRTRGYDEQQGFEAAQPRPGGRPGPTWDAWHHAWTGMLELDRIRQYDAPGAVQPAGQPVPADILRNIR